MNLEVFSIYDSKISDYSNPMFLSHVGEALRGWEAVCNDASTKMNKYPEDFTLFHIGTWDSTTASFKMLNTPKSLATALSVIRH